MGLLQDFLDQRRRGASQSTSGLPESFTGLAPSLFSNSILGAIIQLGKGNPLIQSLKDFGLPLTQAAEQQRAEEEAAAATEARFQESRGIIGRGSSRDVEMLQNLETADQRRLEEGREAAATDLSGTRDDVLFNLRGLSDADQQAFSAFSDPLLQGFRDRESSITAELEGLGEVDRSRLNRGAEEELARQQAQLASRGLGSSTLLASAGSGVERERLEAENDLNERLRRERIGVLSGVGGDTLAAQERLGAAGFGVGASGRAQTADAANQFALSAFDLNRGFDEASRASSTARSEQVINRFGKADTELLNLLASRNDIPPNLSTFLQSMMNSGGRIAPQVDTPSTGSQLAGPIIQGTGTVVAAKILVACIDVAENVMSPNGMVPLGAVQVGDRVLGDDGEYCKVLRTDMGRTPKVRLKDFVAVTWEDEKGEQGVVRMTYDHPVQKHEQKGDDWTLTEVLPVELEIDDHVGLDKRVVDVTEIEAPSACADLELEGCDGYWVSGLYAASMLKRLARKE